MEEQQQVPSMTGRYGQPDGVEADAAADTNYTMSEGADRPEVGGRGEWKPKDGHPTVLIDQVAS